MARIPQAVIDELKSRISLERLAEARGVVLTRRGGERLGLCPFHDDHEPSLVINVRKNLWHCLGACQSGGSVIDWVMRAEGVSFRHAVELLQDDYVPLAARGAGVTKRSTVPKLPSALERDADDAKLLAQVIDYYHETLKTSPEAMAYLEKRGIAWSEAVGHFKLGFANRTLGYRLPAKNRKEGLAIRGQLQRIGVLRASGHEHFNGSLVIPVIDERGEVQEVYGRKILDGRLRKGTPMHLYLPGPHAGVWNAAALSATSEVIVCESLIDALSFWVSGYRNVTAAYGVEGFTESHLSALKTNNIERVLIAYDRDAAGDAAATKLAAQLMAEGLDCYRIQLPKGMDVNSYACQVTPATKSLGLVIRKAEWMGKGEAPSRPTTMPVDVPTTPTPLVEPEAVSLAADCGPEREEASPVDETPLPAAVIPQPPVSVTAEVTEHDVVLTLGSRRYRVRGLEKNLSYESLRVNLLVSSEAFDGPGEALHIDTLDLYQARARGAYIREAASELGVKEEVIKHDVGKLLLELERLQDEHIQAALTPKSLASTLTESERQSALSLLHTPDLIERIQSDFARLGLVGETTNKLVAYLACVSRKLDSPLALLVQSTSAAGKSTLMDAVLALIPEEDRVQYSAMTGQSLYYLGETDLKHKVLAIVEEEGASQASYALKLLQSEGELTIASTAKDPATGKLATQTYHVEGPVSIFLTTTAVDLDEELLNRCLVLVVDEGRDQTKAIHRIQREKRTLKGLYARAEREQIITQHRHAQVLLEPLSVVNPYAEHLTFVDGQTRTRRDHEKYLTLIDAIALLHQHQREVKTLIHGERTVRYVEVTVDDIVLANRLAHEVLGRTLDELAPQTRALLRHLTVMVNTVCEKESLTRSAYHFSRRQVREYTGWGNTQLRVHLGRLVEMEYLLVHRGGRGQSFVYELLYDGDLDETTPRLCGLIDPSQLVGVTTTQTSRGSGGEVAGSTRPQNGAVAARCRSTQNADKVNGHNDLPDIEPESSEKALLRPDAASTSYPPGSVALSARAK